MIATEKAAVLIEALPYIRQWAGQAAVIKVGGEVLEAPSARDGFAKDVVLLRLVGLRPVIVHGGGRQITEAMQRAGKQATFAHGLRVTDAETIAIVKEVLIDDVNASLVEAIRGHGGDAVGLSGEEGPLFTVRRARGPGGEDLGFVGEIDRVDPSKVQSLLEADAIPIVASLGTGPANGGTATYNINADTAAGALAGALGAQKVVFLTNVPGLYRDLGDRDSLISEITVEKLEDLIAQGALSEGMVPKIAGAVESIKSGVPQVHILDGRVPHAILLEIFTEKGIGTMVLP